MKSNQTMIPLFIVLHGPKYKIESISHGHKSVADIASNGIRYRCVILGMEKTLVYEGKGIWYVENF